MDLYYYILHIYVRYTIPFNIHNNRKHFQLIIQRSFLLCCTFMLDIHIEYTPIVRNIISLFFIFTLLLLIKKHPLFVLSHIAFFYFYSLVVTMTNKMKVLKDDWKLGDGKKMREREKAENFYYLDSFFISTLFNLFA